MVLLEGMKHVQAFDRNNQPVWLTNYYYQQKWAEWGPDKSKAKYINDGLSLTALARLEHFTTSGGKTSVSALTFVDPEQQETTMTQPGQDERNQRKSEQEAERDQRKDERAVEKDQREAERLAEKAKRDQEKHDRQFEKLPDSGEQQPPTPNQDLPEEQPPPGAPTPGQLPA